METPNLDIATCPVNAELAGVLRGCSGSVAREWGQAMAGAASGDGDQIARMLGGDLEQGVGNIRQWLEQGHRMDATCGEGMHLEIGHIVWAYGMLRQVLLGQIAGRLGRALRTDEILAVCRAVDCESAWRVGQAMEGVVAEFRAGADAQAKYMSFLSHDLRGSLNGVILMLEVLKREMEGKPEFEESLADLSLMRKSILDTVGVMDRHSFLDRLRRGRIEVKMQEVDVGPVVKGVVDELAQAATAKGDELQAEVFAEEKVKADPKLLAAALRELVDNAIRHGTPGVVRIGCEVELQGEKEFVALSVSDPGPGIDPERLAKLVDPVRRLELRERGLGLTIVHQVCRVCGGRVEATSAPERGSTFRLIFQSPRG